MKRDWSDAEVDSIFRNRFKAQNGYDPLDPWGETDWDEEEEYEEEEYMEIPGDDWEKIKETYREYMD